MATLLTVFPDEELVDLGDVKITLTLNFKTITVCESIIRDGEIVPMPLIAGWVKLQSLPPLSVTGKVLWALMREHHEQMTMDEVMGLVFTSKHSNRLSLGMQKLLDRHFDFTEQPKEKVKNPPKRRGPSKPSSEHG
jgi:hypothetical protein